ncbi:MAG TPA: hypothetical protein VEX13_00600 [Chloroflexia bacterium]|nr:hypothetical protein [Chloroflexia bacterium]
MPAKHNTPTAARESTPAPHTRATSAAETAPLAPLPLSPASVLANSAIRGRGNGPLRQAAILQLQQAHGNRAARSLVQRLAQAAPISAPRTESPPQPGRRQNGSPASPVQRVFIQRAVGFEFETGWLVKEAEGKLPTAIGRGKHSSSSGGMGSYKNLKKKDLVASGAGFRVEADEALNDQSELEFVVDPPIEATKGNEDGLYEVLTGVTLFGAHLLDAGNGRSAFTLDKATAKREHEKFLIIKADNELKAGPQVTAGISLEKISEIGAPQGGASLPDQFNSPTIGTVKSISTTIDEAKVAHLLPGKSMSPQLKGLLTLLTSYLWAGENKIEYPKQLADVFLLARTDFAQLFRMLPEEEKDFYHKKPELFVQLGLTVSGHDGAGDVKVISRGIRPRPEAEPVAVGPGRAKWLFFMTQGFDLLSKACSEEFESMGEFGRKTEKVGTQQKDAGIFEFRGAQTKKIPLLEWAPFAMQVFKYLINLEAKKK